MTPRSAAMTSHTPRVRPARTSALAGIAALLLLLAACGGDSASTDPSGTDSTPSASDPTGPTPTDPTEPTPTDSAIPEFTERPPLERDVPGMGDPGDPPEGFPTGVEIEGPDFTAAEPVGCCDIDFALPHEEGAIAVFLRGPIFPLAAEGVPMALVDDHHWLVTVCMSLDYADRYHYAVVLESEFENGPTVTVRRYNVLAPVEVITSLDTDNWFDAEGIASCDDIDPDTHASVPDPD